MKKLCFAKFFTLIFLGAALYNGASFALGDINANSKTQLINAGEQGLFNEFPLTPVDSTQTYPRRSIGRIGNHCTGTLIGPRHVLTAAHCVYNRESNQWIENLEFTPGLDREFLPFHTTDWVKVYLLNYYIKSGINQLDYAVVFLKEDIGKKVGWLDLHNRPIKRKTFSASIFGYDLFEKNQFEHRLYRTKCPINITREKLLNHRCDQIQGMSGAPIQFGKRIAGLSLSTSKDNNHGLLFIKHHLETINSWLDDTQDEFTVDHQNLSPSPSKEHDELFIENHCHSTIETSVVYEDLLTSKETLKMKMKIAPGERIHVGSTSSNTYFLMANDEYGKLNYFGQQKCDKFRHKNGQCFKKAKIKSRGWGTWIHHLKCW